MTVSQPACGVWFFPNLPAPQLVDAIITADRLGIDEVWLGDEGPAREPFTVLAAAAMATTRVRLGVGITNPYVRHPAVAAASIATIAELAPGRVMLGVGAGGTISLAPFGLAATRPVASIERFIDIVRAGASGTDADGYVASDIAVAAQVPPVPIYVGARGPRLNRLASARADGAFVAGIPPFRYDEVIGWARSDRAIEIALYPSVAFGKAGRDQHRPEMIWSLLNAPPDALTAFGLEAADVEAAADAVRRGDPGPASAMINDDILDQLMVIGEPTAVGERLATLVEQHRPASIGAAIIADDLEHALEQAALAFGHMRNRWSATSEEAP